MMMTAHSRTRSRAAGLGLAALLASVVGYVLAQSGELTQTQGAGTEAAAAAETIIQSWPEEVRSLAKVMIERYGAPEAAGEKHLIWYNNGPWLKTVVHRDGFKRALIGKGRDHLEQIITYRVPANKAAELARFDARLVVDRDAGELASRADSETLNFLALNLADDIVKGQKNADAANIFYEKVKTLEMAGKSSPYLDGLMFTIQK